MCEAIAGIGVETHDLAHPLPTLRVDWVRVRVRVRVRFRVSSFVGRLHATGFEPTSTRF